jgi:hypothetical protein
MSSDVRKFPVSACSTSHCLSGKGFKCEDNGEGIDENEDVTTEDVTMDDMTVDDSGEEEWVPSTNSWAKTYTFCYAYRIFPSRGYSIQTHPEGGYIVAGYSFYYQMFGPTELEGIWVLRLDEGGNIIWQKIYAGREQERAYAIGLTGDGPSTAIFIAVGSDTA